MFTGLVQSLGVIESIVPSESGLILCISSEYLLNNKVLPGDFVQFWTGTWGHCGIVKEIHPETKTMLLYSSFPSTNGYGVQKFSIPEYCYFVRLN